MVAKETLSLLVKKGSKTTELCARLVFTEDRQQMFRIGKTIFGIAF